MPMSVRDLSIKQPKKADVRFVGKDGKKATLNDKIEQLGIETALFKNEEEEPVGIRLDSVDQKYQKTGERGQSEWLWIQPGEQAKVPIKDVSIRHRLKRVE